MIGSQWLLRRILTGSLLTAFLAGGSGCSCCGSSLEAPDVAAACRELPPSSRRHVHTFLMSGADPFAPGSVGGVRDYVQTLGFTQTYHGQFYHGGWIERQMDRIRKEDGDARFVLIAQEGTSAKTLQTLGTKAAAEGAAIDVLLLIGGSEVVVVDEAGGHFPVRVLPGPDCLESKAALASELRLSAGRVPVRAFVPPPLEPGPTPRPVTPQEPLSFGPDWDSLQPASRLAAP
jgi:hypothetical protein